AVAEPVERDAHRYQQQKAVVVAGERIAGSCADLCREAECRELVGGEPARRALGHPRQGTLFERGCQRLIDTLCRGEARLVVRYNGLCAHREDAFLKKVFCAGFFSVLHAAWSVNSSDSRGTL